jgi:hypothetical protein
MGLTIHYQLTTTGNEAHARKLVQQLSQAALDLPFQHVGEIIEFQGDQCDWKQRPDDDPYRWLLIQAGTHIALPVSPSEERRGVRRDRGMTNSPVGKTLAKNAARHLSDPEHHDQRHPL